MTYLFFTTLKNSIRELFHNIGRLIFIVIMLALVVFSAVAGSMETPLPGEARSMTELAAIVLALYLFVFLMSVYSGFQSGATFFTMSDVNFLFTAPISQKRILLYGLIKQMGTSLLVGVFLLYQYGWIHQTYGLSFFGIIMIMLGYAGIMFCAQLTAMTVYSFLAGNEKRKSLAKRIFFGIVLLLALWVLLPAFRGEPILEVLVRQANSPLMTWFPIAGWLRSVAMIFSGGSFIQAIFGLLLTAGYVVLFILLTGRVNADYYEDVLKATEISFSAITARKEGRAGEVVPENVKVGKTGLEKGAGSSVFFHKHMLEDRRSKLFFLDRMTLIIGIVSIAMAYFMREMGLFFSFFFATYMQIFSSMMGRWAKELLLPYIYLVPERPFRKLMAICRESVLKAAFDAVIVMVPIGLILSASPLEIIAIVLARFGFGVLFMAGGILAERVLGGLSSKMLITMFYFMILVGVVLPGIVIMVVLNAVLMPATTAFPFAFIGVWNILVSVLILFLCRNMLQYAELNNR